MSQSASRSFAINGIESLLQVDKESASDIATYTLSLKDETEIQLHLLNLLGEGEESLRFISSLMEIMKKENRRSEEIDAVDTGNGISKTRESKLKSQSGSSSRQSTPESVAHSERSVKSSPARNGTSSKSKKGSKKLSFENLKDIEQVLHDLEVTTNVGDEQSEKIRKCNCMGTQHRLFDVAPNCLNCGKIICAKEGLQPCSFCGEDILSKQEKAEIMTALKDEKNRLLSSNETRPANNNTNLGKQKAKKIVVSMTAGQNLWDAQNKAFKTIEEEKRKTKQLDLERQQQEEFLKSQDGELKKYKYLSDKDAELIKAQERLETLLEFQDTGAERTKIIDNAADYELPSSSNSNIWLSPLEKALKLKKQQKRMRKAERLNDQRTGRAKKNVVMAIRNGKVVMEESFEKTNSDNESEDEAFSKLQTEAAKSKLEREKSSLRDNWDYENYDKRWERPVYKGHGTNGTVNDADIKDRGRVQFVDDTNPDALIVSMP